MVPKKTDPAPKEFRAACGLFCPSCTLYIGTTEDPERLERLARVFGMEPKEIICQGCGSGQVGPYCKQCKMVACARDKGIDFCGLCDDYPCPELKEFQAAMPHRIELWNDQVRLIEIGFDRWFEEKMDFFSCPDCGTVNSAYDLECRNCGRRPSCEYTARHGQEIREFLEWNKDRSPKKDE